MRRPLKARCKSPTNILQRLRELALQSANGSNSDDDRTSMQQEFTALSGELTRIATTTTFGGRNLLDGSFSGTSFQVGANSNESISFGMRDVSATALKGTYNEASGGWWGVATCSYCVTALLARSALARHAGYHSTTASILSGTGVLRRYHWMPAQVTLIPLILSVMPIP